MRRIGTALRKSTAAALAAITLALSVALPVLDGDLFTGETHFEAPGANSCGVYVHNHEFCIVLAASAVLVTQTKLPELSRSLEVWLPLPDAYLAAPQVRATTVRSRAPPRA